MVELNKKEIIEYKAKRLKPSELRKLWLSRIFIWVIIVMILFPLVAVIAASLAKGQAFSQAGRIFPKEITFDNYINVIKQTDFLIWVKNSLFLCVSVSLIQLVITAPASFAFSRLKFWGRRKGLMSLLILQMFPQVMALPSILALAFKLGFMDHLGALVILMCGGSAYNIWLLKGFMDGIPKELDEAAYVDGASTFQTFIKIVLPLTKSMLVVIFIFAFIGTYGEFILTSALMKDSSVQTVATGLQQFVNNKFSTNWTEFSAAAVMASLPIMIVFSLSQKFIAKGLVAGAVKG
ncbi:sugar ABC transporter permease [Clostridium hydrogenum]|uniref:sugar ABC transporter permease n=1 Tax=Clostridium hydrogenum TaxID=2855764 RepID=UPI001F47D19E|nr:sugar ABC transporter permease [Clostridium hydrogenum]